MISILPRKHIIDQKITRPDWTLSSNRPVKLMLLDKNENSDEELLNFHRKKFDDLDPQSLYIYPDLSLTYKKLAENISMKAENIVLGAGSDGIIRTVFETFVDHEDKVLITSPSFAMYEIYGKIYNANIIKVEYESKNGVPFLPMEKILKKIRDNNFKLFCLPNPDSPTGTVFSPKELEELILVCNQNNTIILIDEAYFPFYKNSCIELIQKYNNLIISRTFAKAWGLAGLRIGYGISNIEICTLMQKMRAMYEANTIAVNYLNIILDHEDKIQDSVKRLNDGKEWFVNSMKSLGFQTWIAHGNFSHISFGSKSDEVHKQLSEIALYRKNFSEDCLKGYSRFSSTTKENFQIIYNVIKKI